MSPSRIAAPEAGGRPTRGRVRLWGDRVSFSFRARGLLVGLILLLAVAALAVLGLMFGDYVLSPGQVLGTLAGGGSGADALVVLDFRLPRVVLAALVGIAFGVSGGVFQSISKNALGSPDIIGFTTGAASGALLQMLVFGASALGIAAGAVIGGLATALVVYLLAYKGGVQGYRLVLVGIGVSAMLTSLNSYLITETNVDAAQAAAVWLTGTLNGRGWTEVQLMALPVLVLVPLVLFLNPRLALMEMGDDAAKALGVPVERSRAVLMLAAVALIAVSTAAVGPIAFIALAAPHVARMLSRADRPSPLLAGLTGAVLLMASDFAAQRLFAPTQLPTGVLTGAVGGVYLAWLLTSQWRRSRG